MGRTPATVQINPAITVTTAATAIAIAISTSRNFSRPVRVVAIAIKELVVNRLVYFYVANSLYRATFNRSAYFFARKTSSEIYNRFHLKYLHKFILFFIC
jgi:hypothetical protein